MLAAGRNRRAILLLLYHLSSDERIRKLFTYTDAIPIVMQMIINFPGDHLGKELVALAVNLSWNARNAEVMCHCKSTKQTEASSTLRLSRRRGFFFYFLSFVCFLFSRIFLFRCCLCPLARSSVAPSLALLPVAFHFS